MKWIICLYILMTSFIYASEVVKFQGFAYNNGFKEKLAYTEEHVITYDKVQIKESLTTYFDQTHKKIATLSCNYQKNRFAPECIFNDLRTGQKEITSIKNNKMKVSYQESSNAEVKISEVELSKTSSASQGLFQYIVHLKQKQKDEQVTSFVFPSRGMDIDLKIKIQPTQNNKTVVNIDVNNFLLRMFTKKISMTLNKEYQLVQYSGNSNISTNDGEHQNVYIEYIY